MADEPTAENPTSPEQPAPADGASPPPASPGFSLGLVIEHAKQVITNPVAFYRAMPKTGGISEPLIFLLVMGAVSGALFGLLSILGLTGAGMAGLGAMVVLPIGLLIGGFISAALLFVVWKLMGSPESYSTAYRCVAYACGILPVVTLVSIIPYLGTALRVVWGTWLMIIASTEVHGRSEQSARIVFGILGALALVSGLSGEYAQRNIQAEFETRTDEIEQRLEKQMESLEGLGVNEDGEIDPEKVGRAFGEFMKGMEEAVQEAEKAAAEAEAGK